jgi:signal transduction histidine kinase
MNVTDPTTIILILEGIAHFLIVGLILTRRNLRERSIPLLLLYVALSFAWMLSQILTQLGWMDVWFIERVVQEVPRHGALLLALFFLHLTRSFLRLLRSGWIWWVLGLIWIAASVVLDVNPWAFPEEPLVGVQLDQIVYGLLASGSMILVVSAWVLTIRAYRKAVQPLHRNRITYWPLALTLTLVGSALLFAGYGDVGIPIYLLATPIAAYVSLTHRLPDVRQSMRWTLTWLITTVLAIAIYTGGFVGTRYAFQFVSGYGDLAAGAAMALVLAIIFRPLLNLVQRMVRRLISGSGYDPSRIVREYSARISNIVDLERLAEVIVGVISEAMEIQRGVLFLVRPPEQESGRGFTVESVKYPGESQVITGVLTLESPVTQFLQTDHRPLTQYAIDLLPQFHETPREERAWLTDLGLDVYVPIYAKGEWSGLLALGAKVSGDRYFDDDLNLLSTLADQTAVALENARLVEELQRANADLKRSYVALDQTHNELEQAYGDLEQANEQLKAMDNLKTGFIGVITHELRTPFANLNFSLQLMERYGVDGWKEDQREQLVQLKEGIGKAKQMVDNLVTFATLLSKQGELEIEDLDFAQLVETSIQPLRPLAERKALALQAIVPTLMLPVKGDRERLGDAIYHLIQNAIKFTDPGGTVEARCRIEPGKICFEVEDTGVGVPADRLPALWDTFTQMADPLKRGAEGLGLGLALVRFVVHAHGGDVYAESNEAVGSTFGFWIPLAEGTIIDAEAWGQDAERDIVVPGVESVAAVLVEERASALAQDTSTSASEDASLDAGTLDGVVVEARDDVDLVEPEEAGGDEATELPLELETQAEEVQEQEEPSEDGYKDLRKGLLG